MSPFALDDQEVTIDVDKGANIPPVIINGRTWTIKEGVQVVPYSVADVLKNSNKSRNVNIIKQPATAKFRQPPPLPNTLNITTLQDYDGEEMTVKAAKLTDNSPSDNGPKSEFTDEEQKKMAEKRQKDEEEKAEQQGVAVGSGIAEQENPAAGQTPNDPIDGRRDDATREELKDEPILKADPEGVGPAYNEKLNPDVNPKVGQGAVPQPKDPGQITTTPKPTNLANKPPDKPTTKP